MATDRNKKESFNSLLNTKDLIFVWRMISQNILIILFVPVMAYFIGYVYTYRLQYKYGAKIQLLLKSQDTYDYQDQIYQGLGAYGMYMDVQNQMRILRSKDIIDEVVDKIDADISYFIVGRIKKKEVYETLPFKCEADIFNAGIHECPIEVEILGIDDYKIRYVVGPESVEHQGKFGVPLVTNDLNLTIDRAYTFSESNIDVIMGTNYEIVCHSRNYLINKYKSSMSIENLEYTSILEVKIVDELVPRAHAFLDTLSMVYTDFSIRQQLDVNQNTLENIEKQIDTVTTFIEEKERDLLYYKDSTSTFNPEKEEDQYLTEYFEFGREERTYLRQKASIKSLRTYMMSSSNEHVLPPYTLIEKEDLELADALAKIREKQIDLELLRSRLKEDHEKIQQRNREILMLKSDIVTYLDNLDGAIDDQLVQVRRQLAQYESKIKLLPSTEQGILNIQRELDVNSNMLIFLLEKKTNTLIARAGIIPQVQVVESTSSLGVVEPNKPQIIRLFTLAGFILGLVLAFVRKKFFDRVTTVKELKETTDLTVLGGVPRIKEQSDKLAVLSNPKSNATESFRGIRTNLMFLGEEKPGIAKKIMVSSFFPQEGKTLCSTNLSTLVAMGDKKVLLIDFDLHRPKIHKMFGMDNNIGVSTFAIGKAEVDEIIRPDISENLDVITAGPIAPNPSELVMRKKIDELFALLETRYDYIFVDSAPFGLLNDSLELAKKVDVFTVIFNCKFTRRRGIQRIEELLEKFDNVEIGVILNNIQLKRLQYYYAKYTYKYSYSYGYNYGYGYGYGPGYDSEPDD